MKPGQPAPYQYDKRHLVLSVHSAVFRFTAMMNIPWVISIGAPSNLSSLPGPGSVAQHLLRRLVWRRAGRGLCRPGQCATLFVNFSNIGWFGNTVAIDQHLQISRMRALEFERPMVRTTNTGATAIIDHPGVVTHALGATRGC